MRRGIKWHLLFCLRLFQFKFVWNVKKRKESVRNMYFSHTFFFLLCSQENVKENETVFYYDGKFPPSLSHKKNVKMMLCKFSFLHSKDIREHGSKIDFFSFLIFKNFYFLTIQSDGGKRYKFSSYSDPQRLISIQYTSPLHKLFRRCEIGVWRLLVSTNLAKPLGQASSYSHVRDLISKSW